MNKKYRSLLYILAASVVFFLAVEWAGRSDVIRPWLYPNSALSALVWQHVQLVAISSALSAVTAIVLSVLVTRPAGKDFQPLAGQIASIGQTFPPVAVLALAVPALGFGFAPTMVALWLYGLLPILRNGMAGLVGVPAPVLNSAQGMGMSSLQSLTRVELPLAAPVILAGIRTSLVINVGTAMIGALIGAGGLGVPIVAGLVEFNLGYILEGAIPGALLALLADQWIAAIEAGFVYRPR